MLENRHFENVDKITEETIELTKKLEIQIRNIKFWNSDQNSGRRIDKMVEVKTLVKDIKYELDKKITAISELVNFMEENK